MLRLETNILLMSVVLIFVSLVFFDRTVNLVIKDLANRNARVNLDRLNREHFQRPEAFEPYVAETGGNMHKQS